MAGKTTDLTSRKPEASMESELRSAHRWQKLLESERRRNTETAILTNCLRLSVTNSDNEKLLGAIVSEPLAKHTNSSPNTHFPGFPTRNCPGFQAWAVQTGSLPTSTRRKGTKRSKFTAATLDKPPKQDDDINSDATLIACTFDTLRWEQLIICVAFSKKSVTRV